MSVNRKQPGVAFWATVVAVLVLAYPISFGPACWLVDWGWLSSGFVSRAFRPIVLAIDASDTLRFGAYRYAGIGAEYPEWTVIRIMDAAGLIPMKSGSWPRDMRHDISHRSGDR
jgi:hypothetical protein